MSDRQKAALNKANASIGSIKNQLTTGTGLSDTYTKPDYTAVTDAKTRSISDLQNALGTNITFDRNAIEKIYQDSTKQAYNTALTQQKLAEKNYNSQMATAQNTAVDTMRQQQGQAVASGASKGMQAANVLSAILGTSQTMAPEATTLAQARATLGQTYGDKLAQNSVDALTQSNTVQQALASLSRQLYNDDIQSKTAELAYNQGINTDSAGYQAQRQAALASIINGINSNAAGIFNGNQSALAQIQASIDAANAQRDYATITANATKYSADKTAAAYGK